MSELTERERWRVGSRVRVPVRAPLPVAAVVAATCASSGFVPTLPPPLRATSHHSPLFAFSFHFIPQPITAYFSRCLSPLQTHTRTHTHRHTSHLIPPTPNSSISSSPASSFSSPSPSPPSTCIYRSRVYPQTPTFAAGPSMVLLTMPRSSTHAFSLSSLPSPPAPPPPPLPSFLPSFLPSSTSVPSRPRSRSHSHFPPPFILSLYDELSGCLTVLGQSAEWRSGSVLGP
ncbi:hypothetical protein Aperf_G00000129961 [Anoplocephala perfoliata]